MAAVRLEQIVTLLNSNDHGFKFICLDPAKEPGSAIEFEHQLPILALGRNR